MTLSKQKVYAFFALSALFCSQLLPNFAYYDSAIGRWVPHIAAFCLGIIALMFGAKLKVEKKWVYVAILAAIFSVVYVILHSVFVTGTISSSDIANIFRFILSYLAFLLGYFFFRRLEDFEAFIYILILMTWFVIALAVDFYANGLSVIQKLYVHRLMGFRFSGTYGWPYNNALFLFMALSGVVMLFAVTTRTRVKVFATITAMLIILLILLGGARSAFLAVILISATIVLYLSTRMIKKKITYVINFWLIVVVIVMGAVISQFSDSVEQIQRLMDFENVTRNRGSQIADALEVLLSKNYFLMFGLGSLAVDSLYVESGFNYIFRFGIVGTILVLLPFAIYFVCRSFVELWRASRFNLMNSQVRDALCVNMFVFSNIIFSFFMLTSTNAHTRFRYVFLLFFVMGMYAKFLEAYGYKKGAAVNTNRNVSSTTSREVRSIHENSSHHENPY